MDISRKDLEATYARFTTNQLLEVIDNKTEYTELALIVVLEELVSRKLTGLDIEEYKNDQAFKLARTFRFNVVVGLTFFQKVFFFFLWPPISTFMWKQNFRDDGYMLKLSQANYYSWSGGASFFVLLYTLAHSDLSEWLALGIWIPCFWVVRYFDDVFNRGKQIELLKERFEKVERW